MEYHGNLLNGIISQAKKLGYNVLVFSLFSITDEITPHQLGEENIYRLSNFNKIAGIVFMDISIWAERMRTRVYEYITENFTGPVICANSNNPKECLNQCIDEIKTFSNMTEHLITCHGMKKIYCLTGFKGNKLADISISYFAPFVYRKI